MIFQEKTYFQASFEGLASAGEEISSRDFEECEFRHCSLIETRFLQCSFLGCRFIDCVLSAVKLPNSRFAGTELHRCKAIGIDWSRAAKIENLGFEDCRIDLSCFRFVKGPGTRIVRCEARDVDFIEAGLPGADLRGTDLDRSVFFKTDLTGADLRGARNYAIDVRNNILKGARFSFPEVMGLFSGLDIIVE